MSVGRVAFGTLFGPRSAVVCESGGVGWYSAHLDGSVSALAHTEFGLVRSSGYV